MPKHVAYITQMNIWLYYRVR